MVNGILEAQDEPAENPIIFIPFPTKGDITDEDSANEDEAGNPQSPSGKEKNELRMYLMQ